MRVDWVGVTGLPLALLGLWLTWAQAKRVTSVAVATENAARRTQQRLQENQLLILIPQLRLISAELSVAIEDNNRALVRRQLDNWRGQASHLHGILSGAGPEQQELLARLQQSIGIAAGADSSLLRGDRGRAIDAIVLDAGIVIGLTCDELNAWAGRRATEVPASHTSPHI